MVGRGGQATLSRQQVVDEALRIVESGGVEGLTVRRLSGALSVAVTSIYWHVGDKEAVLGAVAEEVIARFGRIRVSGPDPRARVTSAARHLRRMLHEQSELVALVHAQGRTASLLAPARLAMAAELRAAGLDDAEVVLGVHAVLNHVVGSVLVGRQVERQPVQEDPRAEVVAASAPPALAESRGLLRDLMAPMDDERQFAYGLAVLIDGILGR